MRVIFNCAQHVSFWLFFVLYSVLAKAQDNVSIDGVGDMITTGQDMIRVAAKWGGIITVVGAALALGSGKLEGALAQTICKVIIVIALIIAAFGYFGKQISWGFAF